jgi:hypothetical protein
MHKVSEDELSAAFAEAYQFIHPHLKEGFTRSNGLSSGLSSKWHSLLYGPNDGGRDSFRNLTEQLSARAAVGSCRQQRGVQQFSWKNSDGCVVEEPHPGVFVFRDLFAKDWCQALLEEIDHMQSEEVQKTEIVGMITQLRPNSMNNYGVHLNIVGMRKCMDDILEQVLQPLAMALYMNDHLDLHNNSGGTDAPYFCWQQRR